LYVVFINLDYILKLKILYDIKYLYYKIKKTENKIEKKEETYLSSHFLRDVGVYFPGIRQSNIQKIGPGLSPYVTYKY